MPSLLGAVWSRLLWLQDNLDALMWAYDRYAEFLPVRWGLFIYLYKQQWYELILTIWSVFFNTRPEAVRRLSLCLKASLMLDYAIASFVLGPLKTIFYSSVQENAMKLSNWIRPRKNSIPASIDFPIDLPSGKFEAVLPRTSAEASSLPPLLCLMAYPNPLSIEERVVQS